MVVKSHLHSSSDVQEVVLGTIMKNFLLSTNFQNSTICTSMLHKEIRSGLECCQTPIIHPVPAQGYQHGHNCFTFIKYGSRNVHKIS